MLLFIFGNIHFTIFKIIIQHLYVSVKTDY